MLSLLTALLAVQRWIKWVILLRFLKHELSAPDRPRQTTNYKAQIKLSGTSRHNVVKLKNTGRT